MNEKKVEKKIFGVKVNLYNFAETGLLNEWETFSRTIESCFELREWFDFFQTYCQEIHVINPLFDKDNQPVSKYDENISLTTAEIDILKIIKSGKIMGVQGEGNRIFINAGIIKSIDVLFATIVHEMTHVFETIIARESKEGSHETIYSLLNKKSQTGNVDVERYVKDLTLSGIEGFEQLNDYSYKDIAEIAEAQKNFDIYLELHHELLEYALEFKVLETIRGKSIMSKNIENFNLLDALEILKKALGLS